MSPEHVTIIVLSCVLAVAAVAIVASLRSRLATAKREWLELSALLTHHSMPHCAKILECLAVEDLPGAFRECEYLLRLLRDPKAAAAALDAVLVNELPNALSDATRRQAVAKAIADWLAANPTLVAGTGLAVAPTK